MACWLVLTRDSEHSGHIIIYPLMTIPCWLSAALSIYWLSWALLAQLLCIAVVVECCSSGLWFQPRHDNGSISYIQAILLLTLILYIWPYPIILLSESLYYLYTISCWAAPAEFSHTEYLVYNVLLNNTWHYVMVCYLIAEDNNITKDIIWKP